MAEPVEHPSHEPLPLTSEELGKVTGGTSGPVQLGNLTSFSGDPSELANLLGGMGGGDEGSGPQLSAEEMLALQQLLQSRNQAFEVLSQAHQKFSQTAALITKNMR